jgi:hypothetical protein
LEEGCDGVSVKSIWVDARLFLQRQIPEATADLVAALTDLNYNVFSHVGHWLPDWLPH